MNYIEIEGGRALQGELTVQSSKNAALPMMAAALLTEQPVILKNCPHIEDVQVMCELLRHIGAQVVQKGNSIQIHARSIQSTSLPDSLVSKMRSSIILLGPLLARAGKAAMTHPGGCVIGARPIDLHIAALKQMGCRITEEADVLMAEAGDPVGVIRIYLKFPSVGATENILMYAALSRRRVILSGAAREPEVTALAAMLRQMGVRIEGIGTDQLSIWGAHRLRGVQADVIPDRIVTGTYLLAAAATKGKVRLNHVQVQENAALFHVLESMGCEIETAERAQQVVLRAPETLRPVRIRTEPYPGFATDLQAVLMVAMTQAEGVSNIEETIFENRFRHVEALRRMGARIQVSKGKASVHGVSHLQGCALWPTDLRAGAAMVIAGLCAKGRTQIKDLTYIERGYEDIVRDFRRLGADISMKNDE